MLKLIRILLHWLVWIAMAIGEFVELFSTESFIDFQCYRWVVTGLVVSYLVARWFTEKQSYEECGPISQLNTFLLWVEVLLQNEELVYLILIDPSSYGIPLLFCAVFYVYDFVWRYFYKFQEVDDMCYLVLFCLTGVLHDIFCKRPLWPIIVWTIVTILIRLGWIWWQQWLIYSFGNSDPDDPIRKRIVSIQCSRPTADIGHVYVVVGDDHTFELFKNSDQNNFTARPARQDHALGRRRNVGDSRFYIPIIQYGVVGVTTWSDAELGQLYNTQFEGVEDYSSSYDSCQEFAFRLVDAMSISKLRFNMRITLFKALMTAIALYSVPLIVVLIWSIESIEIHYRQ